MAELEIHHEGHEGDPLSRTIGIVAALVAMLLAIVTIASHRSHTKAVLLNTNANDKWNFYEVQRMKFHSLQLGQDILGAMPATDDITRKLAKYTTDMAKYDSQAKTAQEEAHSIEAEAERVEDKANKFDIGEGLLEISVVMISMFFISKNKLFPVVGGLAALTGVVLSALAFLS